MSDVVPHKDSILHKGRLRKYRSKAKELVFVPEERATVFLSDGSSGRATCLGCHDAPCIELTEDELGLGGSLGTFPGDPSRDVCPTNAIDWNAAEAAPRIDPDACVGCGLCALRCPYGAINLNDDGMASVEATDPDGITVHAVDDSAPHEKLGRRGALGTPRTLFARSLPNVLAAMTDTQATRLARNLFAVTGVAASMRRKGDTNIRMDGLLRFASGQIGIVELETGASVLESPRALLEDIAVLHGRFGVARSDITPVSVIGSLPNVRVEYYQVIDDIENVLDIRCRTVTMGLLCMIAWNFGKIDEVNGNTFTTASGETDLYRSIDALCLSFADEEPYPGAYRPPK